MSITLLDGIYVCHFSNLFSQISGKLQIKMTPGIAPSTGCCTHELTPNRDGAPANQFSSELVRGIIG